MAKYFEILKIVSASSTSDYYNSEPAAFASLFVLCLFCCGIFLIFLSIFLFFYYIIRKSRIEQKDEYVQDVIARIWYRTFLITPKGMFVLLFSLIGLTISFISIEFSVISTISFFFLLILGLIYLYSVVINIYFYIRAFIQKKPLVNSYLNFHSISAGDAVKKRIQLEAPFPWGYIIKMVLFIPPILGDEIRSASGIKSEKFINFETTLPKSKRGEYKIGPVIVEYEDVLGLTKIQLVDSKKNHLKILPNVLRLKKLNWQAPTNKYGDDIVTKRLINTDDFFDLREYKRGDDIKKIHWKVSAKADKFMMRVPEITTVSVGNFAIMLDNVLPGDSKTGKIYNDTYGSDDLLDRMIEIIASIIDFSLKYNNDVELTYFDTARSIKTIKFNGKRREELLNKLININWVTTSRKTIDSFIEIMNDKSQKQGVFYITSETSTSRNSRIIESIKNKDSINMMFIEPTSFLKYDKKKANILSKIFLLKPYLEQYPKLDSLLTPNKKDSTKVKLEKYNKIKIASKNALLLLKNSFKHTKIFRKETDYINELER